MSTPTDTTTNVIDADTLRAWIERHDDVVVMDVRSAAEVDMTTVCVRTGGFPDADLKDAGARAVYDDLAAVQEAWAQVSAR